MSKDLIPCTLLIVEACDHISVSSCNNIDFLSELFGLLKNDTKLFCTFSSTMVSI